MCRYIESDKVAAPVLRSFQLLDQLCERIDYLHYSLQTEKAYLYWTRFFIRMAVLETKKALSSSVLFDLVGRSGIEPLASTV
jgi:hypothetical protein